MSSKISDYQGAIRIIQEIFSGKITQDEVTDIVLKIAELDSKTLVEARNSASGMEKGLERVVIDFLRNNQKIRAIKEYRLRTGVGLRIAKDAVDIIEKAMKEDSGYLQRAFLDE